MRTRENVAKTALWLCEWMANAETSGLTTREDVPRVKSNAAEKLNGLGDLAQVSASFAAREKGCADCIWRQYNWGFEVVQYKDRWWLHYAQER